MNNKEIMLSQIKAFEEATGIVLDVYDGKPFYHQDLTILKATKEYALPDNIVIMGNYTDYSKNLVSLGTNFIIYGFLSAPYSKLKSFPQKSYVHEDINLKHNKLTSFPSNYTVRGNLDISYNPITEYPKDLFVYGSIDISNTDVKEYTGQSNIYNILDISNTKIESLNYILVFNTLVVSDSMLLIGKDVLVGNSIIIRDSPNPSHDLRMLGYVYKDNGAKDFSFIDIEAFKDTIYLNGRFYKVVDKEPYLYTLYDCGNLKYLAFNNNKDFAIKNTKYEAIQELALKVCTEKLKHLSHITSNSELSYSDIIRFYNTVIGSVFSSEVIEDFEDVVDLPKKDVYKVGEVIDATEMDNYKFVLARFVKNNEKNINKKELPLSEM